LFGVPDVESIDSRVIVGQSACCKYGYIYNNFANELQEKVRFRL
jgi:hypothetical protein